MPSSLPPPAAAPAAAAAMEKPRQKEEEEVDHDDSLPPAYIQEGLQSEEGLGQMLELQLQVVFPLELPSLEKIFLRHNTTSSSRASPTNTTRRTRVLDVGCGQGAWACRLAEHFTNLDITGVDLEQSNVDLARVRAAKLVSSSPSSNNNNNTLHFDTANAYHLSDKYDDQEAFHVACCRSMLYTVPHPERIVAQILKTLQPDEGVAHFFCEDYGMVFASPTTLDQPEFWRRGPCTFLSSQGCNPFMGRSIYGIVKQMALELGLRVQVSIQHVPVSTNPPNSADEEMYRQTLGRVFQTWKDYSVLIADATSLTVEHCNACFDDLTAACNNPMAYVSWQCTVCTVQLQGKL
eukprot:scaffold24048_cov194-Amphora_coffeaeformis.AAC.19